MSGLVFIMVFLITFVVLAYQRASLIIWTISFVLLLILTSQFHGVTASVIISWLIILAIFVPLNVKRWRRRFISKPLLRFYCQVMPTMSRTEREAISARTITWEGDLFRGYPNWKKLLSHAPAKLTEEEKAFING